MSEIRELSFCELRRKDIVSIGDGRKLGKIVDLVFSSSTGKVQGIVAPYGKKFLFFRSQEVYIPYCNIKTIGEDIILVDIAPELGHRPHHHDGGARYDYDNREREKREERSCRDDEPRGGHDCDGRCDKCMLFDCDNRWKKRSDVYVDNSPYK